jgi:hypothetical protein
MQGAKANADLSLLRFQQEQQKAWDNDAIKKRKIINDRMKQDLGYFLMNDAGRAVFDNSMARRAFEEASLIVSVIKHNPEQAKYYAENTGWTYSLNGDNVGTLTSPDGKWVFTANEEGMHKLMGDIQKTLMDDITAARIKGTDAQSIPEASAKVMLNNQKFLQVYGTPGNAYHALRSFMDQKVMLKDGSMKDRFTPSQKMIHATSVTLDAAIEDNAFSQAEMAALSAQFVPTVKQFGGEVIWGQGVDDTQIIMRNNGMTRTYPIREFANLLRQRDVITPAFNQHVAEVARRMKLNQAAEQGANAAGTPRTQQQQAIVERFGNPPEGVTIETHGKLGKTYQAIYSDLNDDQKRDLAMIYDNWFNRYMKKEENGQEVLIDIGAMPQKDRLDLLRNVDRVWRDYIIQKELPEQIYSPISYLLHAETASAVQDEMKALEKDIRKKYPQWGDKFFKEYIGRKFDLTAFRDRNTARPSDWRTNPMTGPKSLGAQLSEEQKEFDKNIRPLLEKYIELKNIVGNHLKAIENNNISYDTGLTED